MLENSNFFKSIKTELTNSTLFIVALVENKVSRAENTIYNLGGIGIDELPEEFKDYEDIFSIEDTRRLSSNLSNK